MKETFKAVSFCDFLHDLHGQIVLVSGDVDGQEVVGQLMLRRGDLVVLGLGLDA